MKILLFLLQRLVYPGPPLQFLLLYDQRGRVLEICSRSTVLESLKEACLRGMGLWTMDNISWILSSIDYFIRVAIHFIGISTFNAHIFPTFIHSEYHVKNFTEIPRIVV